MKKSSMKHMLTLVLIMAVCAVVAVGCGSKSDNGAASGSNDNKGEALSGTVTASGSSALLPLVKQAKTEFEEKNADVTINATAGGSGTGLKNVADGTSDIGNSDVEAGDEFKDKNLVDHIVAIAPFALIVNKDVTVDSLTKQQAADIFTGKITNWKEVGGADQPITIIHRPDSSGSRKLVKKIVLDGAEFTKEGVQQESSGSLKTAVESTAGAIGYVDIAYVDDKVKALKFEGVEYKEEAIKDGTYPLYGIEHMYTKGEPTGAVKAFIDYIMSDDFQNNRVRELKFLPAATLNK